ncbi:MAG: hypothetical protein AAGC86_17120 [Pseudomonadota bacterium]
MIRWRIPFWALACLTLVFGSLGSGHALGAGPVAGTVTLCLNGVTITTAVGADGAPRDPAPICPDCVVIGLGAIAAPGAEAPAPEVSGAQPLAALSVPARHPAPCPPVRAPPHAA